MAIQLGANEFKFAEIMWANEPISTVELCKLGAELMNWHKSTTYTVVRRTCEKGIFKNEQGIVSSILSKDEYFTARSETVVNEEFGGSLPAFVAAFTRKNALSSDEAKALHDIVDSSERKE